VSVKKVQESSKTWRGDLYHHMLLRKFLQGNVWNTLAKPWFVFEVLSCQRSSASHRVFSIPIVCKYCSGYFHTHHCTRTQSNKYGQDHRWDYLYKKEISKTFFFIFLCSKLFHCKFTNKHCTTFAQAMDTYNNKKPWDYTS